MAVQQSQIAEAETHFRQALKFEDGPEARLDLARALLVQSDAEGAEQQFQQFIALDASALSYLRVVEAYFLLKYEAPARRWLALGLLRHATESRLHAALGELELVAEQYQSALAAFNKGLSLAPRKSRDRFHVSIARTHLIQTVQALSNEREKIGPADDWRALHQQMAKLAREGKLAILPAVLSLKRALYINPDNLQAHLLLGSVFHQLGRLEEAELEMEQAVRIAPKMARAYYVLGLLRRARGKRALCVAALRQAIVLSPMLRDARSALCAVLLEQGDGQGALAALLDDDIEGVVGELRSPTKCIESLIRVLEESKNGTLRGRAAALLARLSGQQLGDDAARWRKWRGARVGDSKKRPRK